MKKFAALIAVVALVAFAAPALAANPFMDVPMNHWSYDAVGQLASQGVISGYPDGTYKGNQPMTRYEMASTVARALAVVDMNKASKQDVEMLKRLVVEFKDELDALGVDVADLDSRVAVLEENLGGWKFWGEFRFDAKLADNDDGAYTSVSDVDFNQSRYRIWMSKVIDEKVKFIGRMTGEDIGFSRYYLEVSLPMEFTMWVGKWCYDWEGEKGFYIDNDAWFGDQALDGFYFTRPFSMGDFSFYVAHKEGTNDGTKVVCDENDGPLCEDVPGTPESFRYGAQANFNVTDNLRLGLGAVMIDSDAANNDQNMYQGDFTFNFTSDIALKGVYYMEDFDTTDPTVDDSPSAFRAILDVSQDAFGFTSVWLEYASADDSFYLYDFAGCDADGVGPYDNYGAPVTQGLGRGAQGVETDVLFLKLNQKWSDKWSTFQRFVDVSHDGGPAVDLDNTNFTFGVKYYYTSNLSFELLYDDIDYGADIGEEDDSLIRLRTHVKF